MQSVTNPTLPIASAGVLSRNRNVCTNLLDYIVTEKQDFEGDGYSQVDECNENDNQARGFGFRLTIIEILQWVFREDMGLTVASIGYMFAARNQPERPNAMPTSTQRTIGTGMTQRTCINKKI